MINYSLVIGESIDSIVTRPTVMVPQMKLRTKPEFGKVTEPTESVFMRKIHTLE